MRKYCATPNSPNSTGGAAAFWAKSLKSHPSDQRKFSPAPYGLHQIDEPDARKNDEVMHGPRKVDKGAIGIIGSRLPPMCMKGGNHIAQLKVIESWNICILVVAVLWMLQSDVVVTTL